MELNARQRRILNALTQIYLDTGQPVGSRLLATATDIGLSPASIRNVMCELERRGYLYAPHTSAGRIPTDRGLRYFVDTLMVVDQNLSRRLERLVEAHLQQAAASTDLFRGVSRELAQLSHFAGFVSVQGGGVGRVRRMEFVPVSSEQVLAVLVTDCGEVKNRLLPRPARLSDARLAEISQRLSIMLADCDLMAARTRLLLEMKKDHLRIRDLIRELISWKEFGEASSVELFVSGQRQLLEVPELSVIDTVRSLLAAFEDKEILLQLINHVQQLEEEDVAVLIGSEHALVNMQEVSLVMARFKGPAGSGTLGVIGPRRMHYDKVLPLVACTARGVSRRLGGIR